MIIILKNYEKNDKIFEMVTGQTLNFESEHLKQVINNFPQLLLIFHKTFLHGQTIVAFF